MNNESSCPASHYPQKRLRGEKSLFNIYNCQKCGTLYTAGKRVANSFDYDNYYDETNLVIPEFVERRLREIVRSFERYQQNNRFLDVGCGAGTLLRAALNKDNVEKFPLSQYRNNSFYTMRTDALDRFGTSLEKRFTQNEIRQIMEECGLESITFSETSFWTAVGFKK